MDDFKQQMLNAKVERETGNLNKALEMFLKISRNRLESSKLFDYLGELGLTYWHLKRLDEAKAIFEEAKSISEQNGDNSHLAVALRHLSRPEFNQTEPTKAVELAQKARQLAQESCRQDIAWFDHGVVTALIFSKGSHEEIHKWYTIEAEDIYTTSRHTKDELAKWIWASGLLMDRAQTFNSVGDLYLALMIAEQYKLERRREQIEKLIQEFNIQRSFG